VLCLIQSDTLAQLVSLKNASKNGSSGVFSLGIGSSVSIFSDHENNIYTGTGLRGQMRIQLWDNINSEWFGDYALTNVQSKALRIDGHGGFSVMPYFIGNENSLFRPYPVAGFCIDYSKLIKTGIYRDKSEQPNALERYSFAAQIGLGTHIQITDRVDLSVIAHYMFHLGNDIHIHIEDDDVHFETIKGASLEGHLIFSATVNIKLVDLW
jgi:hypothetical protein